MAQKKHGTLWAGAPILPRYGPERFRARPRLGQRRWETGEQNHIKHQHNSSNGINRKNFRTPEMEGNPPQHTAAGTL